MDVVNAENAEAIFSQRNVFKRNPPDATYLLRISHLPGVVKRGASYPFDNTRYPYRVLFGLFPINAPTLSAAYGYDGSNG
jgi:hypothetical protein